MAAAGGGLRGLSGQISGVVAGGGVVVVAVGGGGGAGAAAVRELL